MNKAQAKQQGLQFHGTYERNKELLKPRAAELRKRGYRAVIVTIPRDKYSRGHGGPGYSIYVDESYFNDQRIVHLQDDIGRYEIRRRKIESDYAQAIVELNQQWDRQAKELQQLLATKATQ